jgi:large repetitive protein
VANLEGRLILTIMAIIFGMMICGTSSAVDLDQNYTNDSDFDSGTSTGLEHNSTSDQLQLSNSSQSAFSYIWVPNSNEGTVSKVDTRTGMEVARYRTSNLTYSNPSRTIVDQNGSCWVANR